MAPRNVPTRRSSQSKKRDPARQTSAVVEAMRNLRPSGEKSFEALTALLLSRLSDTRIRLCKSGTQGGVDAIAEIPFAIEDKRYADGVDARQLEGGLTHAATAYPDLELWVLIATCAVGAQTQKALVNAGRLLGIAVLILDATASEPDLPGVSSLEALAATDIETATNVLADPLWRTTGRKPSGTTIRRELEAIRASPAFGTWEERIRRELRQLPTWSHFVRSQNERLRSLITHDAANAFGTPYDPAEAISRTAEADLTEWLRSCQTFDSCDVAVVTGDRYDGKTWLVFCWLAADLHRIRLPVFFFSSQQVQQIHADIQTLILDQARHALGAFHRHAEAMIARARLRSSDPGPWCVVILDGANEYVAVPAALGTAILWATPPPVRPFQASHGSVAPFASIENAEPQRESDTRRCALVVTCRARDFEKDSSWLGSRNARRVALSAYDDREFEEALVKRSVTREQIEQLPDDARAMVRRPRYLDLMIRHWNELPFFGRTTVDVLHYLDASDKVRPSDTTKRWDPAAFKSFLTRLAGAWRQTRTVDYFTLRSHVHAVTDRVDHSVALLESDGVITKRGESYVPDLELLALGMGLFIREKLLPLADAAELSGALNDVLEPHRDDDEKVRWLRAAVTTSVLAGDAATHPMVLGCLIAGWLSSRNFSQQDLDDLKNLSPLLSEPVLRLTLSPRLMSRKVLPLVEPIIHDAMARHEPAVASAIRQWFRFCSTDSRWYLGEEHEAKPDIARAVAEPSLEDLHLLIADSDAARELQRLGLFLAYGHPSLVQPTDVLALLAGRNATLDYPDGGERFAIRKILADSDSSWYHQEVRSWAPKPEARRTMLLRDLIDYTGRGDLWHLLDELPDSGWLDVPLLTRTDLAALKKSGDPKQVVKIAEKAWRLALDPDCPAPPLSWRAELVEAAIARFSETIRLNASRSVTRDDLDLRDIEPALAAWAPQAGAHVWRAYLADIPRREGDGEEHWSWTIDGHAALLTRADRRALLELVLRSPMIRVKNSTRQHALHRVYVCVIAGSSSDDRLRLVLSHPFELEWTRFYEIAAWGAADLLRRKTLRAVRLERDPRRLMRARRLLGYLGGVTLSASDLSRLVEELSDGGSGGNAEHAVRFLFRECRVDNATPAHAFGRLVQGAASMHDTAWQYVAFLDRERNPGAARSADWIADAHAAPQTARANGAEAGAADDVAVHQGVERLALQIQERLQSNTSTDRMEQFPGDLAHEITGAAFDGWVESLLSSPLALHLHSGLLRPVVRRALQTSHPSARQLWDLAYPFQRRQFAAGVRFTVYEGVGWALKEIHDSSLDDDLAAELLRDLVADCRSDSELVAVALGSRLGPTSRLTAVVENGFHSPDELERANARFLAGWLPDDFSVREKLAAADCSQWVTQIGEAAIRRLDRERWGREWLRRFLCGTTPDVRWAAGRLFLKCSDVATRLWAPDLISDAAVSATRRAEAYLLLGTIRHKVGDSELRDNLLGHRVGNLAAVVPPWRQKVGWGDIRITEEEE
jgi:hypothetical protein